MYHHLRCRDCAGDAVAKTCYVITFLFPVEWEWEGVRIWTRKNLKR